MQFTRRPQYDLYVYELVLIHAGAYMHCVRWIGADVRMDNETHVARTRFVATTAGRYGDAHIYVVTDTGLCYVVHVENIGRV